MPTVLQKVKVCDATGDDNSNSAGLILLLTQILDDREKYIACDKITYSAKA